MLIRDLPRARLLCRRRHDDSRFSARSGGHAPQSSTLTDTLDENLPPIGGNGLVIFNAELRVPVAGGLGVVGFVDTGNVFARVSNIDLGELRTAVGSGVRYKSPFGPIRFDLGFKVNRQPGEGLTAWFISFGQAF